MFINGLVVVRGPVVENHRTKSTFLLSSTPSLPKQQPVSEPDVYELLLKFYLFFK